MRAIKTYSKGAPFYKAFLGTCLVWVMRLFEIHAAIRACNVSARLIYRLISRPRAGGTLRPSATTSIWKYTRPLFARKKGTPGATILVKPARTLSS